MSNSLSQECIMQRQTLGLAQQILVWCTFQYQFHLMHRVGTPLWGELVGLLYHVQYDAEASLGILTGMQWLQ